MNKIVGKIPLIARLLLGLAFFAAGVSGLLQLGPQPQLPPSAGAFLGALAATGYMFPLIKVTEILAGLALLTNRFVPLALVVLAPIMVNIVAFHLFLTPGERGTSLFLAALMGLLGWSYRGAFRGLFAAKATPELSLGRSAAPGASPAFRADHGA